MKLEILLSCMHQTDTSLIKQSGITGDAVVINQCDQEGYLEQKTKNGVARFFSVIDRGLTKSRNMAIEKSDADICLLCDDDEVFADSYEQKIISSYQQLPFADVIIFKMANRAPSFEDKVMRIRFPKTLKVSSWQISFKKESLKKAGIQFDTLLGAGSGNGAEEELKFLCDCEKKGLKIYYVPKEIASVERKKSTWFSGFDATFFENRGATTRYILGLWLSLLYAFYYVIRKRNEYKADITTRDAFYYILKGIKENKISKQKRSKTA